MRVEYRSIGVVHSPYTSRSEAPRQSTRSPGVRASVEVHQDYAEGLCDLDGFSHIILLCHLHLSTSYRLKVVPARDTELRGLFATRSPNRPNPIGLSLVRLVGVHGNSLEIEGVDLLEGTPVLDIKPYVGELDELGDVRLGWLEKVTNRRPQ